MDLLNKDVYQIFETSAFYLLSWISIFFIINIIKISLSLFRHDKVYKSNSLLSEMPGLPLTLLHTVAFIKAVMVKDYLSALLFAYWGPGFLIIASIVIYSKAKKIYINWAPIALISAYACKVEYLIFMVIYFYFDMFVIMFVFSVWIINDQISLAWFDLNADRTRRLLEDHWIFRLCYLLFLFIPIFCINMPYRLLTSILGVAIFILWVFALKRVYSAGVLRIKPSSKEFLRNIVYLSNKHR